VIKDRIGKRLPKKVTTGRRRVCVSLSWTVAKGRQRARCYARSIPSYKLLSEFNLILTQRLTSYPLVLVGLSCGTSRFAKVTDELPTSINVLFLLRGHVALLAGRLCSVAHLPIPPQLLDIKPVAYIDDPAALLL
jgi:hypothetical protein